MNILASFFVLRALFVGAGAVINKDQCHLISIHSCILQYFDHARHFAFAVTAPGAKKYFHSFVFKMVSIVLYSRRINGITAVRFIIP
jgi:hypothetical protein